MPRLMLPLVRREPEIDWPAVITAMQLAGLSLRGIGGALALTHSAVKGWKLGSCPSYENGRALLKLWDREMASAGRPPVVSDLRN